MGRIVRTAPPADAAARRAAAAVVCYPAESLPPADEVFYQRVRHGLTKVAELVVPARDARAFEVPAGVPRRRL